MENTIPRNVRQMGEPEETRKIYVEDYVVTYLRQYAKEEMQNPRAAILLGNTMEQGGIPYLFVRSALDLPESVGTDGTLLITDSMWMRIYEEIDRVFRGQEILGWFLSTPGHEPAVHYELLSAHKNYFPGRDRVLMLEDPVEGEDAFFVMEAEGLVRQNGYFVFYERNEPMQQYMLEKKDGKSVDAEEEFPDRAARSFRTVVQERREETTQKKTVFFLSGISTFLTMIVLVIGITMINNYEKMEQVELVLQDLTRNLEVQQEMVVAQSVLEEKEAEQEKLWDEAVEAVVSETVEEQVLQEETDVPTLDRPDSYIVQKGDTLLEISRKFYGSDQYIQKICDWNDIEDMDKIIEGEKILLPQ